MLTLPSILLNFAAFTDSKCADIQEFTDKSGHHFFFCFSNVHWNEKRGGFIGFFQANFMNASSAALCKSKEQCFSTDALDEVYLKLIYF